MSNIKDIKKFLNKRPTVTAAYGYGSGVFKQSGYSSKDKVQLDLILVVDDLKKWHVENIELNPNDYSFIGKLFFKHASISKLKGLTGITYLSNIEENGKIYKYGTIEEKDLLHNLKTWESFYLPGRFQKTNLAIVSSKKIEEVNRINRDKALYTALYTLPEITEKSNLASVYVQLCGLSYLGDTRMKFAENPRKVLNIVEGSFNDYKDIYGESNKYFKLDKEGSVILSEKQLISDIDTLPQALLDYIKPVINSNDKELIKNKIFEYFTNLNKKESTQQTIKGIYTNGIVRSVKYASSKVLKKIKH